MAQTLCPEKRQLSVESLRLRLSLNNIRFTDMSYGLVVEEEPLFCLDNTLGDTRTTRRSIALSVIKTYSMFS